MKNLFNSLVITLVLATSTAFGQATLDVDGNLPAAADGSTTTLADGTTITLTEFDGGLGSLFPNSASADFDFATQTPAGAGEWSYLCLEVSFGTDFGVNNDGLVSAADFELGVSSLNGSSNWYEFGFLDLVGPGTSGNISNAMIEAYLNDTSNYDDPTSNTEIGTALGADVANDDLNNFDAAGNPVSAVGADNGNDTWDNNDFGLAGTAAISGFKYYYGAVTSDDRSSSPGGSIGDFEDAQSVAAIPEPGSLGLVVLCVSGLTLRRRRS